MSRILDNGWKIGNIRILSIVIWITISFYTMNPVLAREKARSRAILNDPSNEPIPSTREGSFERESL